MPGKTTDAEKASLGRLSAASRSGRAARGIGRRTVLGAALTLVFFHTLPDAVAMPRGDRRLALFNPHTGEHFNDVYWSDGAYVDNSLRNINWLMRDFHRDEVAPIDAELLDLLQRLGARLGTNKPFTVLSGYRSLATNRLLRHEGVAAATNSEHLRGKAADIRIDGITLTRLHAAALSLKAGGVGMYPRDDFIHVDVGPVREW
jgi:uncharacterized protein YcbK (DUF882 family)